LYTDAIMAGTFDAAMKQLLDICAPDWVSWLAPLAGLPASVAAHPLDTDLSTVQPTADKVFRLDPPNLGLLHIEPQASRDGSFIDRLLLYNVLLHHRYGGPVHTIALLLRREADMPGLTGTLIRRRVPDEHEYLRFEYTAVRIWELPADRLLGCGLGATPLALLTDDAAPRLPHVVARFADRVQREANTADEANVILSCAYILLGLRYDDTVAQSLFRGVQTMRESSTYQAILREGRTEGRTEGRDEGRNEGLVLARQEDLLEVLRERFQIVPAELEARVRATTDPERLRSALRHAFHISSPAEIQL
jgi:hypothetical protein